MSKIIINQEIQVFLSHFSQIYSTVYLFMTKILSTSEGVSFTTGLIFSSKQTFLHLLLGGEKTVQKNHENYKKNSRCNFPYKLRFKELRDSYLKLPFCKNTSNKAAQN